MVKQQKQGETDIKSAEQSFFQFAEFNKHSFIESLIQSYFLSAFVLTSKLFFKIILYSTIG